MPATPYSRYLIGTLPWYSALIVTGILAALFIVFREEKRLQLPHDTTVDLALCVIPCGIIGARLYYVLFAWDLFRDDPLRILRIWEGGLAIYGGVIGGAIAGAVFSRIRRIPLSRLMDMAAPALPLAQAIGRWGNYFNQEAYGAPITTPAWQFFPAGVLVNGQWYMATFFYESAWDLVIFIALMFTRRRMRRSGDVFLWYAALYGAGRFVIEGLRSDSLMTGTLRVSQLLSLMLCLTALMIFLWRLMRQQRARTAALIFVPAAALCILWLVIPMPVLPMTALLSLTLITASILAYIQINPSHMEAQSCPQHPSRT